MKIGLIYELQIPHTDDPDAEYMKVHEALDQIELADKLGIDCTWQVEHHFLEEYSHSSAPEVFLAAASQRTKNIRLCHGIVAMPPAYNAPARVAERIAMLDLISNGRVEFGTGETSSDMELIGFNVQRADKRAMWEEAVEVAARMMGEAPFRGYEGKHISVPARNVIPKPRQKPHPPLWVACSRRDTITMAAQRGLGALTFAFIDPPEARQWVDHYYTTLADEGVPIGLAVNPNLAVVTGFMCCEDELEAIDKGIDGAHFFAYSLAHYYVAGTHRPAETNIWEEFLQNRDKVGMSRDLIRPQGDELSAKTKVLNELEREAIESGAQDPGALESLRGAVGTPDQIRTYLRGFEESGVDQVVLIAQAGPNKHEDICASLELFGREVLPEFKERDPGLQEEKTERMKPIIEKVMARKPTPDRSPLDYQVVSAGTL